MAVFLLITVPTILGLWTDTLEKYQKFYGENIVPRYKHSKFSDSPSTYKVLILPFHPLKDCKVVDLKVEVEVKRRLEEINEQDSLHLEILIDSTQDCPATYAEMEQIGKKFRADLVLSGEIEPKCSNDSICASVRYFRIQENEIIPTLKLGGKTDFYLFSSIIDFRSGFLMNQVDYIIYWLAGKRAVDNKNYYRAIRFFEKIPKKEAEVYNTIGYYYGALNEFQKAIDVLSQGIKEFPDYARLYINRGAMFYEIQQYDKACDDEENALVLNPNDSRAYYNLATLLMGEYFRDYELAQSYFQKAITINPNDAGTYVNLGHLCEFQLRDYQLARNYYEIAIKINPKLTAAHNNLAALLQQKFEEYQLARKHYEIVLTIDPKASQTHYNLGILLMNDEFKKYQLSREHLETAIDIDPKFAEAYFYLAGLLTDQFGEYQLARKYYEAAISIKPDIGLFYFDLSKLFLFLQEREEAKKNYLKATEINPAFINAEIDSSFGIVRK